MADFKTHVTVSSVLGCGYAFAGMTTGMDTSTSLVAGGLCGVSGMLPDVDSSSGIPRRETMGFAAAIVPMLLADRLHSLALSHDQMVLLAAAMYFGIRFGASRLIGRFSVHRGMWHSIPAALIFAGLAFLIAGPVGELYVRYFKAFAVFLGAMSHLVLDEVYSVDTRGVVPKFKKSFGTALKFWGKDPWANFSTYAKLAVVAVAILSEPVVMDRLEERNPRLAGRVEPIFDGVRSIERSAAQRGFTGTPWTTPDPARNEPAAPTGWGEFPTRFEPDARAPAPPPEKDRTIYDTARRFFAPRNAPPAGE